MKRLTVLGLMVLGLLVIMSNPVVGQSVRPSFRVETDIFLPNTKPPAKQTLTLFREGVYYDFSRDHGESITVIDPVRGRIIMLDPVRKLQTRIVMSELLALVSKARQELSSREMEDMLPREEEIRIDPMTGEMIVGTKKLEYRVLTEKPNDADMALQYADFADWSARLNAFYTDRPMPPFTRMALNRRLAVDGVLPKEIKRLNLPGKPQSAVIAKHLTNWTLSADDNARVDLVGTMLVEYATVPAAEFLSKEKVAQGKGEPSAVR